MDCTSKAGNAAAAAVDSAADTAYILGGAALNYTVLPATAWAVNGLNEHISMSATICLYYCVGLEYQNGGFNLNYGHGWIVGATASFNYYSHSLDDWCEGGTDAFGGVGPLGVSFDSDDRNWAVGTGPGYLLGGAEMRSHRIG